MLSRSWASRGCGGENRSACASSTRTARTGTRRRPRRLRRRMVPGGRADSTKRCAQSEHTLDGQPSINAAIVRTRILYPLGAGHYRSPGHGRCLPHFDYSSRSTSRIGAERAVAPSRCCMPSCARGGSTRPTLTPPSTSMASSRWRKSVGPRRAAPRPDGAVTLIFYGIKGSTAMRRAPRRRTVGRTPARRHNSATVREQAAGQGGFEGQTRSNGFMIAYDGAPHTLACGGAVRRAFAFAQRGARRPAAACADRAWPRRGGPRGDDFLGAT